MTTGIYKGVTTSELDELAAETAAAMTATHPDYAVVRSELMACDAAVQARADSLLLQLAARIAVSNLHKNTLKSFSETCAGWVLLCLCKALLLAAYKP